MPARHHGCPANDLPTRRSSTTDIARRTTPWPNKSLPSLLGVAHPCPARHLVETTRVEEQGFLATIEGGMARFDQIAPPHTTTSPMRTVELRPERSVTVTGTNSQWANSNNLFVGAAGLKQLVGEDGLGT